MKFIPDRPSEIVSGGYDSAVLHFDIGQGNILSRYDISRCESTIQAMLIANSLFSLYSGTDTVRRGDGVAFATVRALFVREPIRVNRGRHR